MMVEIHLIGGYGWEGYPVYDLHFRCYETGELLLELEFGEPLPICQPVQFEVPTGTEGVPEYIWVGLTDAKGNIIGWTTSQHVPQ